MLTASAKPSPAAVRVRAAPMLVALVLGLVACSLHAASTAPLKPVAIVIQPNGAATCDGKAAATEEQLAKILGQKMVERRALARRNPPMGEKKDNTPEVAIQVAWPEKTSYEDFCRTLQACATAGAERAELAGVPFTLPVGDSAFSVVPRPGPAAQLGFLPMEIRDPTDITRLRRHAAELKGHWVCLRSRPETAMSLVMQVLRALRESGATFGFRLPHESGAEGLSAPIVLGETSVDDAAGPKPHSPPAQEPKVERPPSGAPPGPSKEPSAPATPKRPPQGPVVEGRGFFGTFLPAAKTKIVYVVDRSGSMIDSIDFEKQELKRSIRELREDDEFHVLFYSAGPPTEMHTRRLVQATEQNKQSAFEFIKGTIAQGETDPSEALRRAFETKPEVIYLLTDGEFDKAIVPLVKRLNADGKVAVHTICFLYRTGERVLKEIAEQNNGKYAFISVEDLPRFSH